MCETPTKEENSASAEEVPKGEKTLKNQAMDDVPQGEKTLENQAMDDVPKGEKTLENQPNERPVSSEEVPKGGKTLENQPKEKPVSAEEVPKGEKTLENQHNAEEKVNKERLGQKNLVTEAASENKSKQNPHPNFEGAYEVFKAWTNDQTIVSIVIFVLLTAFAVAMYFMFPTSGVRFPTMNKKAFNGNFVVLGATGSGKTSFIQAMTASSYEDLVAPISGNSLESKTLECKDYSSEEVLLGSGTRAVLTFKDTIGFGAQDHQTDEIITDVFAQIVRHVQSINGFIIVHKAERFREDYVADLHYIKRVFSLLDVQSEHVILAITHTVLLTDEARNAYSDKIYELLNNHHRGIVNRENIIHVNFPRLDEIREEYRGKLADQVLNERIRVSEHLSHFNQPVNPMVYIQNVTGMNEKRMEIDLGLRPEDENEQGETSGAAYYNKLRIRELKKILGDRGTFCDRCVERKEYIQRCIETEYLDKKKK